MKKNLTLPVLLIVVMSLAVGCLRTRSQLRQEGVSVARNDSVVPIEKSEQQIEAEAALRAQDTAEEIRNLRGRIEILEQKLSDTNETDEQKISQEQIVQKFALYEQALRTLEKDVLELSERLTYLKASPGEVKDKPVAGLGAADAAFESKKWKEAILGYQKYREKHPNGKNYPSATYKIGVSFQELGMKDEAISFYEEIIDKYPQSRTAKKARYRLKNIKK